MNRLKAVAKNFPREFMIATSKKMIGKEATKDMTSDEILKVAEELERLMQEAENHD
jgi:HAMP domain-containing protein